MRNNYDFNFTHTYLGQFIRLCNIQPPPPPKPDNAGHEGSGVTDTEMTDVMLIVHLSIVLVINQLNAQILIL